MLVFLGGGSQLGWCWDQQEFPSGRKASWERFLAKAESQESLRGAECDTFLTLWTSLSRRGLAKMVKMMKTRESSKKVYLLFLPHWRARAKRMVQEKSEFCYTPRLEKAEN